MMILKGSLLLLLRQRRIGNFFPSYAVVSGHLVVTDVFGCVTSSSVLHSVYVLIWTAPNFSSSMFNPNPK